MSYGKDDFLHWVILCLVIIRVVKLNSRTMMNHRQKNRKQKKSEKVIVKIVLRLKRTIVPSVLIRMRRYLGCAVIYEKHGITYEMQKVRRPFNILILYISLFDFFFLSISPKMTFYQVFSCNVFTMFNELVN